MTLLGDAFRLHTDGLEKLAGQKWTGVALVVLLQLVWQRCARPQPRLERARSASECASACGRVG